MNFVDLLEEQYGVKPRIADHYGDWLGYEISKLDRKQSKVTTILTVREDHLSPSAAVHGGVISGFLDFTCGCSVFLTLDRTELCSTVELNVKYFKPLKSGDTIIAEAQVVNRGKKLCSVLAKVFLIDREGSAVALATGTFNVYPIDRKR